MARIKKKFLVVADGEVDCNFVRNLNFNDIERIVAADGGAEELLDCGVSPDTVIGDLDSISEKVKKRLIKTEIIFESSQEINDLEKALIYCKKRGASHLIVLGVTGKRLDHSINNFSVLAKYDGIFNLEIFDKYSQIFLLRKNLTFFGNKGQIVSLIPLGKVEGISTKGLQFPLDNETLEIGFREGASNVILQHQFSIEIKNGILLVFVNQAY
jgi:thiamine pyrophosphokinase